MERDFDTNPYSKDEDRVAEFLSKKGIGGGDDPIGFILASYEYMSFIIRRYKIDSSMSL